MTGVPALREAIAGKTAELYGYQPDVNSGSRSPPARRRPCMRLSPPRCAAATR
nr:Methionine aminotransferase [Klebsiella pneumoniae]